MPARHNKGMRIEKKSWNMHVGQLQMNEWLAYTCSNVLKVLVKVLTDVNHSMVY